MRRGNKVAKLGGKTIAEKILAAAKKMPPHARAGLRRDVSSALAQSRDRAFGSEMPDPIDRTDFVRYLVGLDALQIVLGALAERARHGQDHPNHR